MQQQPVSEHWDLSKPFGLLPLPVPSELAGMTASQ